MLKRNEKFGGTTVVAGVRQKEQKNRSSQLLFVLALLITGFGGILSYGGSIVGYAILPIGLMSVIWIFVWILKNWDY